MRGNHEALDLIIRGGNAIDAAPIAMHPTAMQGTPQQTGAARGATLARMNPSRSPRAVVAGAACRQGTRPR
jgi:hypothetical protein